jgi:hypothetical protein
MAKYDHVRIDGITFKSGEQWFLTGQRIALLPPRLTPTLNSSAEQCPV